MENIKNCKKKLVTFFFSHKKNPKNGLLTNASINFSCFKIPIILRHHKIGGK